MDKEHKIASLRHFIGILENTINQMNESEKTAYSGYANDLRKLKKKKGEELRRLLQKKGGTHNKSLVKSMKKKHNTEDEDDFESINRSISHERQKQQEEQKEQKNQERREKIMTRKVSMHHYKTKGHLPNVSEHSEMNFPANIGCKRKSRKRTAGSKKTIKNKKSRK